MNQGEEVVGVPFVSDKQAAEVAEPGKEPFDLPAATVAAQLAAILGGRADPAALVGSDQLDAKGGKRRV